MLPTPQRGLAMGAHFLGSRATSLVLLLLGGHVSPFLCHLGWFPGLSTTAMWTMGSVFIPGLAERKTEHARHGPMPISLLFPAFGQHL